MPANVEIDRENDENTTNSSDNIEVSADIGNEVTVTKKLNIHHNIRNESEERNSKRQKTESTMPCTMVTENENVRSSSDTHEAQTTSSGVICTEPEDETERVCEFTSELLPFFTNLLSDPKFADCTLTVGVNAETIDVHRGLLAAVSPVFKDLTKADISTNGFEYTFPDLDFNSFKIALRFMASFDYVLPDNCDWTLLSQVARKFGLYWLQAQCVHKLGITISWNNVGKLYQEGRQDFRALSQECVQFIARRMSETHIHSGVFTSLDFQFISDVLA
eukprot:122711_1